jgi:hypothetical protein
MKMKRQAFILILILSIFTGRVAAQCVIHTGAGMADICQGGTSAALDGSIGTGPTGAIWSSGAAGGTFTDNTGTTPGITTWTPPAGYYGTATLTLTAIGCTSTDSKTITVRPTPAVTISGTTTVCQNSTPHPYITFTNLSGLPVTINYNINGGANTTIDVGASTSEPLEVFTASSGTFAYTLVSVVYQDSPTCSSSLSGTATVTVTPTVGSPTAITVSAGSDPSCQLTNGSTVTIYGTTATNNTGFNWSLSNGAAGSIDAASGVMTWANGFPGTVDIQVTANGCGSPSAQRIRTVIITPTVGTPTVITVSSGSEPACQLTDGTTTTTYSTTASDNTGFNWSLSNAAAGSINPASGVMTWANGFEGSVNIQVTANGCNGPSSKVIRTVTVTPTVGTPVFSTGTTSTRCQGAGNVTYSATATNSTGITYSLDGASLVLNSINASTGEVSYNAGWSGTSIITATTTGCNAPTIATHTVTITPAVGTPTIPIPLTSTICQGSANTIYTTSATNATSYNWSVSGTGNTISGTGLSGTVTWASGYSGIANVSVTATGCGTSGSVSNSVIVRQTPTVSIGGTTAVCQNAPFPNITFTNPQTYAITVTYNINGGTNQTIDVGAGPAATATVPASTVNPGTFVFILVNVYYQDAPSCSNTISGTATVTVNTLPSPTISGPSSPRITSTGNGYSTESGMSSYTWSVSAGGIITSGAGTNSINVTWNSGGAQTVSVNYPNAHSCSATVPSIFNVTVKPLPTVISVGISGIEVVGNVLTGTYGYVDGAGYSEGVSTYKWFRNVTTQIPDAMSSTYMLTDEDEGEKITFEVTPVSSGGYPNTGVAVKSAETGSIGPSSSLKPTASEVCIQGKLAESEILTGKYLYTFASSPEGISTYRWLRKNFFKHAPIELGYGIQYSLKATDISAGKIDGDSIIFEVTPVSSNHKPKTGTAVRSAPLARITLAALSYSLNDPVVTLTANVGGGVFSGPGVTNGTFSAYNAGSAGSPHTITYNLNIINPSITCSQQATEKVTVLATTATLTGFNDFYCKDGGEDIVSVDGVPGTATSLAFKLTDMAGFVRLVDDRTIVIDPRNMKEGSRVDTLFFSFRDGGSLFRIYKTFVIDDIGQVTISNLSPGAVICNNTTPYELLASPVGGVFEGPVINRIFTPTLGVTQIKYTYTSHIGCVGSVTIPITISPAPVVSFSVADFCIENSSDTTKFVNLTTSVDPVTKWSWEFSEAGNTIKKDVKEPGYLYTTGGLHAVSLTAKTDYNCSVTKNLTIDLGIKPIADFYWKNDCYHSNDSIMLFDTTFSTAAIISRSWNFSDGGPLLTVRNPKYPKRATGYISVEYIVKTSFANCYDTVSKNILIRPSVALSSDDYFQNFETGNGGWEKDEAARNSWSFGKPDRTVINSAASGNNAWYTGYSLTNQKIESSSIVSPCFDFTTIDRPMISLKLWRRFDRDRDGAALQYKIGDAGTWQYVGSLDDGINWFNSTLIKGRPGGDQIGWTTKGTADTKWIEARHTLDELKGKKDVKFRLAYGSDGTSQDNDGIAMDDIRIGERTRRVLLEHFANTSSTASSVATALVNTISKNNNEDIINIQYHTNFPGADLFYDKNPGDASARILFYGLSKAPYSFIDGGTTKDYANIFDYVIADIDSNDVSRRSLVNPLFDLSLNTSVSNGILSVSGQIMATDNVSSDNLSLYIAITEKKHTGIAGANGETTFYNVFRKFFPDAGGVSLKKTWLKGDIIPISNKTWVIDKTLSASDIEVIAFVQNSITKELYQAASKIESNLVVGIEDLVQGKDAGFTIYPNPAVNKLTVAFKEPLKSDADIRIYDIRGIVITTYKVGSGSSAFAIQNTGLKEGIYLIRVTSGGIDLGFKKLLISGH